MAASNMIHLQVVLVLVCTVAVQAAVIGRNEYMISEPGGLSGNMKPTDGTCNVTQLEECWPRFAGGGVAWDCLAGTMSTPFVPSYSAALVRRGAVVCSSTRPPPPLDPVQLQFWVLIILHVALLLAPIVLVPVLDGKMRAASHVVFNQSGISSPGMLLAGLALFSLASLGEIALHVQQQWLYLGLMPSYYNVVFYGGLTFGQAMLAWGISGCDWHVVADLAVSTVATLAMLWGTALANAVPDAAAYCPLKLSGSCTLSTWALAYTMPPEGLPRVPNPVCNLFRGSGGFFGVMLLQFVALACTTLAFLIKACRDLTRPSCVQKAVLVVLIVASYAFGVSMSIQVECTGWQLLHIPTALGFLGGFAFQMVLILSALAGAHGRYCSCI